MNRRKIVLKNNILLLLVVTFILSIVIAVYFIFSDFQNKSHNITGDVKVDGQFSINNDEQENIIILKIAHYFHESHPQHMALSEKFVPMVEEGSNWKIRVEVYPNNQLVGEKEYIQGVRHGTIEMCIGGEPLDDLLPKMKVIKFPYMFDNYDQAKTLLNGELGVKVTEGIEALGIRSLAWSLNGFRQISISTYEDPLTNNEQQPKLKLATNSSRPNIDTLKIMGFDVVSLGVEDTTMILKQRLADGHDNPPLLSYYNGWYEGQRTITITNHVISPAMYMISTKFWNTLPDEYKKLITKAAKESADYEIELLKKAEKDLFDTLKNKGLDVQYPDLTSYKKAVYPLYKEYTNSSAELENIFKEILEVKTKLKKTS